MIWVMFGVLDCVVLKFDIIVYDYGNIYFDVDNSFGCVNLIGVMDEI